MEEKEMSFWGHLEELRRTLFRVVAVLLVFMIACFCVMPDLFDSVSYTHLTLPTIPPV